jgi:hypothetical protein
MCESTNAERGGFTPSERRVGESFEYIFNKHKDKRLIIATFSSNVHRVQQIIDTSVKYNRKVAITGRSMLNVVSAAIELGYMTNPEEDMKMQDEEFQNTMVEGIVAGIETYLDEKKAEEPDEVSTEESTNTGSTLNPEHAEVDEQAAHEKEAQASRDILASTIFTPARKVDRSAKTVRKLIDSAGKGVLDRRHQELQAKTSAEMQALQEALEAEIGRLGG